MVPPTLLFGSGPWNSHQVNSPPKNTIASPLSKIIPKQISYSELDMERAQKYGRVFGFYDMSTPWLVIADPPLLKKILVKNFDSFSSHVFSPSEKKMRTLEQANGQEWKVKFLF